MKTCKKIIEVLCKIVKAILIIILLFVLSIVVIQRFTNNKASIMGLGIYTIISESMVPKYEVGDMILAFKVEKQDLKVGDDVVYQGKENDFKDKVVTHRIIKMDDKIHTKGIANTAEDPPIDMDQIYGKVICKLSILSIFSKLMNDKILFYIIIFVPFTILVFLEIKDIIEKDEKEE